jgi:hypothetical protein
VRLAGGGTLDADAIVCAAGPAPCAEIVGSVPTGARCAAALRRLGTASVTTVRMRFGPGPTARARHGVGLIDGGFVFLCLDEFMPAYGGGQHRHVELQCESAFAEREQAALERWASELYPDRPAPVAVDALGAIAYARYAVGSAAHRPGVHGPWRNLFFAGDGVAEPGGRWFMERAGVTGRAAAAAAAGRPVPAAPARSLDGPGVHAARRLLSARGSGARRGRGQPAWRADRAPRSARG